MAIRRFEDIRAWQEARTLTKRINSLFKMSPGLRRDRRVRDQVQAASVSIMSNIAQGFSRRTARAFTQFLFVAKGSSAEVESLLYVGLDQEYFGEKEFSELYAKAEEVARILSGLITSLLPRSRRGSSSDRALAGRRTQ